MARIYVGFEPAETVAYHVLCQSIIERSSIPVQVCPIYAQHLTWWHNRDRDPRQSNAFTFTRFLVPFLAGYHGPALFMDCDMVMLGDVGEIFQHYDESKAVSVVKHDYVPRKTIKYLGNYQYTYPRKNWASVVLFNAGHQSCKKLTPLVVQTADPSYLLRFEWCKDDEIGELPKGWNYLVEEDNQEEDPLKRKLIHFTNGTPCFSEYQKCEYSDLWHAAHYDVNHVRQRS